MIQLAKSTKSVPESPTCRREIEFLRKIRPNRTQSTYGLTHGHSHHHHLLTSDPQHGAFQLYSLCNSLLVQKIPSSLPFKDAAVLPLAISTAANSLYNKATLGLPYPSLAPPSSVSPTKSVLIWGGSGSVGATSIQLAVASGLKVVTVCSARNIDNVKALGAHAVFDYNASSVTEDILGALKGTEYLGVADCISTKESAEGWTPVFKQLGGRYAGVMPDPPGIPEGAEGAVLYAPTVAFSDREIGQKVWVEWVPEALEKGLLKAKPPSKVVGKGLESLQGAVNKQMEGVSFEKIVVEV